MTAAVEVSTAEALISAINNAQDGDTITLASDITVSQQLVIDADITLDLGGYTLTNDYVNTNGTGIYRFTLITTANVTIQNGHYVTTADESTNGVETRGIVASEGNLKLNSVTVKCNGIAVATYSEGGTLTINGSSISGTYAVGSFANNSTVLIEESTLGGSVCGLYHNGTYSGLVMEVEDSTIIGASSSTSGSTDNPIGVYISGSTTTYAAAGNQEVAFIDCVISGATGIEVKYTDLTLTNCTVTATATTSYEQYNNGSTTTGFAVVSTDNTLAGTTPAPEGTITINSGTYSGEIGLANVYGDEYTGITEATYKIYGGTFDTDISAYVVDGFAQNDNGEVVEATVDNAVAQIGSTYYYSLKDAFDNVSNYERVVLLQDVTLYNTLEVDLSGLSYAYLDLNGHTITFAYDANDQFNGETLTDNAWGLVVTAGTLRIVDYSSGGDGEITTADVDTYVIPVGATGSAVLDIWEGNFSTNSTNAAVVVADEEATVEISGDAFTNSATNGVVLALGDSATTAAISVYGGTYDSQDPTAFIASSEYGAIEVNGVWTVDYKYDITPEATTNGTYTVDLTAAVAGQTVTITTAPDAGYEVASVIFECDDPAMYEVLSPTATNEYQFEMPRGGVTIYVTFSLISTYSVTVDPKTGGTAYASVQTANEDDTVTITTLPDSGYTVSSITCPGVNITTVVENSTYTFTMPAADVTVTVTFAAQSQSSGKGEIGGIIYVNEEYHGILLTQNGRTHILSVAHTVDENGYCTVCKAYIGLEEEEESVEITEEVVEIEDPVEAGQTDSE